MYRTTEINALIDNAKQQRAEYIGEKVQGAALPVALAALLSFAVVLLAGVPSQEQAQQDRSAEITVHNG
ncbi:MAG: hypothetical protein WBG86_06510 [Polyangiales bacterium]